MGIENSDTGSVRTTRYTVYAKTMVGGRSENQDHFGVCEALDQKVVTTVCDGMGGAVGGATASAKAVTAILAYLSEEHPLEGMMEQTEAAVKIANNVVYQEALSNPALRGMGTTTTVAVFDKTAAYLAYVGDSRIYQLRNGKKRFRTFDHSRVFELVKIGALTEEQARVHPQNNIIMRALGIRPEVQVDVFRLPYKKGDRFVLCCDGVWNSMPEPKLISMLSLKDSPEHVVERLTLQVDALGRAAGGHHDNLTAIVVDMHADSAYQPSFFETIAETVGSVWHSFKGIFKRSK